MGSKYAPYFLCFCIAGQSPFCKVGAGAMALFEEEATDRMGYTFIESQVSKKIYKFVFS